MGVETLVAVQTLCALLLFQLFHELEICLALQLIHHIVQLVLIDATLLLMMSSNIGALLVGLALDLVDQLMMSLVRDARRSLFLLCAV